MIHDPERLSIVVSVDDSVVDANASVSLGLIITELVINALKHAFPDQKRGKIVVDYRSHGRKWTLSVTDDGVGMPRGEHKAKPGLGTGIVEALSRQLQGHIHMADASPRTAFTLVHGELAGDESQALHAA
jgi:two-component sensor histidine kinase